MYIDDVLQEDDADDPVIHTSLVFQKSGTGYIDAYTGHIKNRFSYEYSDTNVTITPYDRDHSVLYHFSEENKELTIFSITHDIDEALLSDKVLILSKGKLVKEGKPQDVLRDEATLISIKLDMPFVYKVEKELKEIGIDSKAETIDQLVEDIWASK